VVNLKIAARFLITKLQGTLYWGGVGAVVEKDNFEGQLEVRA